MGAVYFVAGMLSIEAVAEVMDPHEDVNIHIYYLILAVSLLLIIWNIVLYRRAAMSQDNTSVEATVTRFVQPVLLTVAFGLGTLAPYFLSLLPRGI